MRKGEKVRAGPTFAIAVLYSALFLFSSWRKRVSEYNENTGSGYKLCKMTKEKKCEQGPPLQ